MKSMTVETTNFPQERFLERDLSWLSFNERVLDLAQDVNLPILERARFLAIFASNLDEFFKVRIAGSKRRIEAGIAVRSVSGMLPRELLSAVLSESLRLQEKHSAIFEKEIRPVLEENDIKIVRWNQLSEDEKKSLGTLFIEKIFPLKYQQELQSLKQSCFTCPMFEICNGCKKTIKDLKDYNMVEDHCFRMKKIAPDIIQANGLTGILEPTSYVKEY